MRCIFLFSKIYYKFKSHGVGGVLLAIYNRIFPKRSSCFQFCEEFLSGKSGLEIGGPSSIFKPIGVLPIYPIVGRLDNCNFASMTTWEGEIKEGLTF